ncbi:MAG: alpha/beta hydrolase [Bdellovibrionales bacterium]|nr:alpha/beta hydrolase [Bdellovibrionales bacterium]
MSYLKQFYHQFYGPETGTPLVFLHGLLGSGTNWRQIISGLENRYRILTFDQRGHGRSFHSKSGYAPEEFAKDLITLLEELSWEQILLVGHSMGGRNAVCFASQWPHKVKKLVLEDIAPESTVHAMGKIKMMIQKVPTPFSNREQAKQFFKNEFPHFLAEDPQANTIALFFYSNLIQKDYGVDWRFDRDGILAALGSPQPQKRWNEFVSLKVPTLIVRGQNSKDLSPELYQKMLALNPWAKGIEIPAAGHWVHYDQPQKFIEVLIDFFTNS